LVLYVFWGGDLLPNWFGGLSHFGHRRETERLETCY